MRGTNPFTAPLRIVPRFSPICARVICAIHALLVIAVSAALPISGVSVVCVAGIIISALCTWRELRALPSAFSALLFDSQGRWWATTSEGLRFEAMMSGAPLNLPWLIVVPLTVSTRRYTLVMAADVTPRDLLRRVRIGLKHRFAAPTTTSEAG
jgi:hypothetical protein